ASPPSARPEGTPTSPLILLTCTHCRHTLRVSYTALGKEVQCPRCGRAVAAPRPKVSAAPKPAAARPRPAGPLKPVVVPRPVVVRRKETPDSPFRFDKAAAPARPRVVTPKVPGKKTSYKVALGAAAVAVLVGGGVLGLALTGY